MHTYIYLIVPIHKDVLMLMHMCTVNATSIYPCCVHSYIHWNMYTYTHIYVYVNAHAYVYSKCNVVLSSLPMFPPATRPLTYFRRPHGPTCNFFGSNTHEIAASMSVLPSEDVIVMCVVWRTWICCVCVCPPCLPFFPFLFFAHSLSFSFSLTFSRSFSLAVSLSSSLPTLYM